VPPKQKKQWSDVEVAPEVLEAYERLIEDLFRLECDKDDDGDPEPFILKLTPEARKEYIRFYNSWADQQAGADGVLASAFSKIEGYAPRLALLHHVVTQVSRRKDDLQPADDCDPVGLESMRAGIELALWFAREARRVCAMLGESEDERNTRRLVEFIQSAGGRITARRLHLANQSRYRRTGAAELALDALVNDGLATWENVPPGPKGGRPTKTCVLKNLASKPDETPEDDEDEGFNFGDGPENETPPPGGRNPVNTEENRVSSGFEATNSEKARTAEGGGADSGSGEVSSASTEGVSSEGENGTENAPGSETVASKPNETSRSAVPFTLAHRPDDLATVLQALDESTLVGLDCETTGLNARSDRVRLLSLATDRGKYLVDCFALDPRPLWEALAEKTLVIHNAAFDLSFLAGLGFAPGAVRDTMLLSQLLHAGHLNVKHTLAACVERELGRRLDKAEQKSDWSGQLTFEQLAYAAADATCLAPLHSALMEKIAQAGLETAAAVECRAIPAVVWLSGSGVAFNPDGWSVLARDAEAEVADLRQRLDAEAPPRPGENVLMGGGWNWDSPAQVKEAFAAVGVQLKDTNDRTLATVNHPLGALLRKYRAAAKRVSTYGLGWLQHVAPDGRIYAGWRQLGADSGRMACRKPNLQNQPRDKRYRRCYVAPPGGVLVKADYSAVEMRIAAKITGDRNLLDLFQRGLDPHTRTAQLLLGQEDVSGDDRQLAKSANFGLLYGMGWRGYQAYARTEFGLTFSDAQAQELRSAFFRAYPGLADWHREVKRRHASETRTLCGRRRLLDVKTPDTWRLNTPVQGTGADGLKQALALLWERRAERPEAFPVLAVHDEIVVEADDRPDGNFLDVAGWLKQAMLDGMAPLIAPVPVAVEVSIAPTWGGAES
jgi:DNA polymerase-1